MTSSQLMMDRTVRQRKMELEQETFLFRALLAKQPKSTLPQVWERQQVAELIHELLGVQIAERTLTSYLMRWGMVPEKPIQEAHRSNPTIVRSWMRSEYPSIAMQAKIEKAEIRWLGTAALRPPVDRVPGNARRQLVPASSGTGTHTASMIFLMTNRRHVTWSPYEGADAGRALEALLEHVLVGSNRPMHLIDPANRPISDLLPSDRWSSHSHLVTLHRIHPHRDTDRTP